MVLPRMIDKITESAIFDNNTSLTLDELRSRKSKNTATRTNNRHKPVKQYKAERNGEIKTGSISDVARSTKLKKETITSGVYRAKRTGIYKNQNGWCYSYVQDI